MVYHGQSVEQVVAEAVEGYADLEQRLRGITAELEELASTVGGLARLAESMATIIEAKWILDRLEGGGSLADVVEGVELGEGERVDVVVDLVPGEVEGG